MQFNYTVGIRPAFWPFYKKYAVVGHTTNAQGGLILNCLGGSVIVVPEVTKKYLKIFPDKIVADDYIRRAQVKDNQNAPEVSV